jgi:serine/threonine protein kinase
MEYLPFKDLDKQIKNGDSYNIIKPKIKNIMRQLFLGLEYLH